MRPSKSYFYKLLYTSISSNLKQNPNLNFLDFACGHAQLLHDFKFTNYIGVDIDEKEILKLRQIFPQKSFFHGDILYFKSPIKGDVACCVETFGFNTKFDKNQLAKTFDNIINNLNPRANFYFNIHKKIFEDNLKELDTFLKKFDEIEINPYGFFTSKCSPLMHKLLFRLEKIISRNTKRSKYVYVKCLNYSPNFSIK